MTADPDRRPTVKPARRRRLAWLLLGAGASLVLLAVALTRTLSWDRLQIAVERWRRLGYASAGQPLPGTPDLDALDKRLAEAGVKLGAPVFIRIFKLEFEMEMWLRRGDRFELFATYPICRWSGVLGPKLREGDRQAPEGFYTVDSRALNPHSRWHRSFNLGYPNVHDRAHGRTGSYLMVHGGCSSIGCYAMTNPVIDEIWRLITAALDRGQRRFHVHIFPFRMTEERLARHAGERWSAFWHDLKAGYDTFEATRLPPRISVCRGRYAVMPAEGTAGSSSIVAACPDATDANT